MVCLRCGLCCITHMVVIIKPEVVKEKLKITSLTEHDFIVKESGVPCPFLIWKEGKAFCTIHHYKWYKKLPCYSHGQIECSPEDPCRMGKYYRDNPEKYKKMIWYYCGDVKGVTEDEGNERKPYRDFG